MISRDHAIRARDHGAVKGHLRRRGDAWQLVVDAGRDPLTGRRRQITRTVRGGRREAQRARAQLVAQVDGEGAPARAAKTVGELIERWFELADLAPNTALGYRSKIDQYLMPAFGDLPLRRLTPDRLDAFYAALRARGGRNGKPLAVNTVRGVHRIVRRACEQAVRWGWLARNPAALASPPRGASADQEPPEPADLVAVLTVVAERDPDLAEMAQLAVITGARRSELCGLQWGDLELDAGVGRIVRSIADTPEREVRSPKTKQSSRVVALDPATVDMLRSRKVRMSEIAMTCGERLKPTAFVFSEEADGSRPLRPLLVSAHWRRLAKVAGVRCRFHDLRHFTATQLIAAGIAVTTVSQRLGHASAKMTVDVYGHPVRDADRHAVEVLASLLANAKPRGTHEHGQRPPATA